MKVKITPQYLIIQSIVTICLSLFLAFEVLGIVKDYPAAVNGGKTSRFNRFRPDFSYLVNFGQGKEVFDPIQLSRFRKYYSLIVKDHSTSGAYALLGYCYYQKGEIQKALEAYQASAKIDPNFWGTQFNLGVLYYNKGDYQTALEHFSKTAGFHYNTIIRELHQSNVHLQLIITGDFTNEQIMSFMDQNHINALYYFGVCFKLLGQEDVAEHIFDATKRKFPEWILPKDSPLQIPLTIF